MYFSNFTDNQIYYSKFIKSIGLYQQIQNFYEFYNFHSIPITFNEKTYINFKFNFLQTISLKNLFIIIEGGKKVVDQREFYSFIKEKYPEFSKQMINLDDFKNKPVNWREFNIFLEKNFPDETKIDEFLGKLSVEIKQKKLDYQEYKKLLKQTKKSIIISTLTSIFSRKKDMNYKVLKTERVYSKNVLNILNL